MNIPIEVTAEQLADILVSIQGRICVLKDNELRTRTYICAGHLQNPEILLADADRCEAERLRLDATFEYLECFLPGVRADI